MPANRWQTHTNAYLQGGRQVVTVRTLGATGAAITAAAANDDHPALAGHAGQQAEAPRLLPRVPRRRVVPLRDGPRLSDRPRGGRPFGRGCVRCGRHGRPHLPMHVRRRTILCQNLHSSKCSIVCASLRHHRKLVTNQGHASSRRDSRAQHTACRRQDYLAVTVQLPHASLLRVVPAEQHMRPCPITPLTPSPLKSTLNPTSRHDACTVMHKASGAHI